MFKTETQQTFKKKNDEKREKRFVSDKNKYWLSTLEKSDELNVKCILSLNLHGTHIVCW